MISKGVALLCEMGVGKTKIAIDSAEIMHSLGLIHSVLVISPLNIVDTWCGELTTHSSHSIWTTMVGDKKKRINAIEAMRTFPHSDKKLSWGIINTDGLLVVEKELGKLKPDLVIIDESTSIKHRTAKRTKVAIRLFKDAKYKIIMSGNPIPKGADEIFSQYLLADEGVFGNRYYSFAEQYLELDYFNNVVGMKNEAKFQEAFHSIAFRKTKDECLSLPPKTYEVVSVEMGEEQKKAYKDMKKEAITVYNDHTCSAPYVISQFLRLSQIAGGFFPVSIDDNGSTESIPFPSLPKINAMLEIIEGLRKGEQVVVWARFRKEIQAIEKALTEAGRKCVVYYGGVSYAERVKARQLFLDKKADVFIGNPQSGGKGLNDLIGAGTVVYYSNDYSSENRQQSEDRNHRNGSVKVTYIDLVSKGTIDETVLAVLRSNKDFSDAVLQRTLTIV